MAEPYRIRPAHPADLPAIAAGERECFSDPWSQGSIAELFNNETVLGLVAESGGSDSRLAGYVFARAIAGEGEILNIAVLPADRGRGVGGQLLDRVLGDLDRRGVGSVFLEVRESNEAARRLYLARGFRPVGLRTDYYRKPRENALVLRRELKSALN